MASTFLNLSTDTTLGGNSPSDSVAVSQKAIKSYVDNNSGDSYTSGTGISIASYVISVDNTVVTTNTAQDITARKTFFGDKAIYFKQNTSSNKLGFTLYDNNNKEVGALEFRPNSINGTPILTLNSPSPLASGTSRGNSYVGFRYWDNSLNILAPYSNNLYNKNLFIPVTFTNGTTTVESTSTDGSVDISSLLPTKTSDLTNDSEYITNTALTGYATESYVDTGLATKQATLISGTNIKTINNTSILGSGNIDIQGGSTYTAGTGIDITNDVISVTSPTLINRATGSNSIVIFGYDSYLGGDNNIVLGRNAYAYNCSRNIMIGESANNRGYSVLTTTNNVAVGAYSATSYEYSTAIGAFADVKSHSSIQLGYGENNTDYTLQIGFYQLSDPNNPLNYTLLDGTTGLIPSARIAIDGTSITVNSSGQLQASGGGGASVEAFTAAEVQTIWESV